MKIKQRFVMILLFIILVNSIGVKPCYALDNLGGLIANPDIFISKGNKQDTIMNKENVRAVSDSIYNILLIIATVLAVGIISILGIKYMIGSAEGKAEVKDSLIPFIVGCIVVFGSFTIWKVVILMTNNL